MYEIGDLSGKFGTLDGLTEYMDDYNDTNLPLFGYESIIGRSIIIHKKDRNIRWACSSLERGYSPSEAREIRAIASFHHPKGYAYGYMRFTQLVHSDGTTSDTVIEVNLRHPGINDRNTVSPVVKGVFSCNNKEFICRLLIITGKYLSIRSVLMRQCNKLSLDV